nr:immunoglobulin light chain junction region [Macaca mulatta]MOX55412.1 immunoglobulin light chain junction region [Macaca mulatta]MOX56511.1 immunoglobulin light chain junction region [Macaca mulatta]MOX56999.1 immunoglobulin light chain junction region [Macaca mulatta]
CMQGVEFPFTF